MKLFTNLHRDGMPALAEQAVKTIRKSLPRDALWVVAIYGNGRVRIFRFCAEFPPVGTMYCVGPYDRNAQPEHVEEDILHEMRQATRGIAA